MTSGAVSDVKPNGNVPPAAWTALLECAESAENGVLDLDGGAPQVVALAERLVDLGFLSVPQAGRYALTQAGRELLRRDSTGLVPVKLPGRIPLFLCLALAAIAAGALWLWPR